MLQTPIDHPCHAQCTSIGVNKEPPMSFKFYIKKIYDRFIEGRTQGYASTYSLSTVVWFLALVFILSLSFGVALLALSLKQIEHDVRYDNAPSVSGWNFPLGNITTDGEVVFTDVQVDKRMEPPVYMYYKVTGYYGNHKRYVRSVDWNQMAGDDVSAGSLSICDPERFLTKSSNSSLPNDGLINPCGLIAHSYFNDSYLAYRSCPGDPPGIWSQVSLDEQAAYYTKGKSDVWFGSQNATNFNTEPSTRGGGQLTASIDQSPHFIAWMRVPAQPSVMNLFAAIYEPIDEGCTIRIVATSQYHTAEYGGEKHVILTTQSVFGGHNPFLGILYLVIMGISLLALVSLVCANMILRSKLDSGGS